MKNPALSPSKGRRASFWPGFHALPVVKPSDEGEPEMHEDYKGHGIHPIFCPENCRQ